MNNRKISILSFIILIAIVACKKEANKSIEIKNQKEFNSPDGMVWVNGKTFLQGAKELKIRVYGSLTSVISPNTL